MERSMFITLTIKSLSPTKSEIHVRTTSITSVKADGNGSLLSVVGIGDLAVTENSKHILNWICDKEPYIGRPVPDVDVDGNVIIHVTPPAQKDDNKSVHNDADVAKIETLQSQLDEQQKKLKTITDLLINKGMI